MDRLALKDFPSKQKIQPELSGRLGKSKLELIILQAYILAIGIGYIR
jgi:hypothetical protein